MYMYMYLIPLVTPINLITVPPFPIPVLKKKKKKTNRRKRKEKVRKLKFYANLLLVYAQPLDLEFCRLRLSTWYIASCINPGLQPVNSHTLRLSENVQNGYCGSCGRRRR
jgi:hypothetical protein